ncbi:MAG: hypothetical protein NT018_04980 [Armatimonadetes bacterium]|nr:hypothetical protein [Armatimonadota bacterium]
MTYHEYLRKYRADMQDTPINIELEHAYWRIGWLRLERIEELATQMMEESYDDPSLVKIAAGLADSNSVDKLFERAMEGIGQHLLTEEEAAKRVAGHIATDILTRALSPEDGASLLIQVRQSIQYIDSNNFVQFPDWLDGWCYWEDAIEDHVITDKIRLGIVEDARQLIEELDKEFQDNKTS